MYPIIATAIDNLHRSARMLAGKADPELVARTRSLIVTAAIEEFRRRTREQPHHTIDLVAAQIVRAYGDYVDLVCSHIPDLADTLERRISDCVKVEREARVRHGRNTAGFWSDLESRFRALPDPYHELRADWDYVIDSNDVGSWRLCGGSPRSLITRYEALAREAGVALEKPMSPDPLVAWLHELRTDSGIGFRLGHTATEYMADGTEAATHIAGTIDRVIEASADYCAILESRTSEARAKGFVVRGEHADAAPAAASPEAHGLPAAKQESRFGSNIDRLRKECGWSYDELAKKTGIEKKSILSHVNRAVQPYPRTKKTYADAFSKKLGRPVTVEELEQ